MVNMGNNVVWEFPKLPSFGIDSIQALERENKEILWGSMIKQTLKRRKPGFNESYYGFSSFSDLLEEAAKRGQLDLELDEKSGGYIVLGTK